MNPYQGLKQPTSNTSDLEHLQGSNQHESLSGIETVPVPSALRYAGEVPINMNPYQGLKRLMHEGLLFGTGSNQHESLSGIETQLPRDTR